MKFKQFLNILNFSSSEQNGTDWYDINDGYKLFLDGNEVFCISVNDSEINIYENYYKCKSYDIDYDFKIKYYKLQEIDINL